MSDEDQPKQNSAIYEPGTLDQTRRNIGKINKEEAMRMTKILGGQVFTEKSTPIDYSTLPKPPIKHHPASSHAASVQKRSPAPAAKTASAAPSAAKAPVPEENKRVKEAGLPDIPQKNWQYIDRLMMSPEYHIKPNYGFFNFVRYLQKNGMHRVLPQFAGTELSRHIDHLQAFITIIKTLIQVAPASYKAKIQKEDDLKFRFLRKIAGWSVRDLKVLYVDIQKNSSNTTIPDLVPFTREIYSILVQILYLGETKVSQIIKEIYTDEANYPDMDRKKVSSLAREGISEWVYLYTEIIKGLYPLLMRMCGGSCEVFPTFFTVNVKQILSFLNKNKFDILVIEKDTAQDAVSELKVPGEPDEPEEEKKEGQPVKKAKSEEQTSVNPELVKAGTALLDNLFPDAGFTRLDKMPDLYPYFQPMFDFDDGFNLLSPENPLQVTIVLLRIIEDLFHGCRNVDFQFEASETGNTKGDTISQVLNDWSVYREMQFDKGYATVLSDFVNELYTQSDFAYSQYGKKLLNKLLWLAKYHFLPLFKFEKLLLERPENDTTYRPLYFRTQFITRTLTELAKNIDKAAKNKSVITGVQNPWDHYRFDIPNPVSERLDVLLAAKRTGPNMTATNANLIKYTLCIVSVLNWWLNDSSSPAYQTNPMKIYRTSQKDGSPVFSIPVRDDQKKLFVAHIQAMAQKKAEAKASAGTAAAEK